MTQRVKKRYRYPDHFGNGYIPKEFMMYSYATGRPIPTVVTGESQVRDSGVAPAGTSTGPTSLTPTSSSEIVSPTAIQTASSPTRTDSPIKPALNTLLVQPVYVPTSTLITSAIPVPVASDNQSGRTPGGFGGGGGAMGSGEATTKEGIIPSKKKSSIIPWILILAGIYIVVQKPIK